MMLRISTNKFTCFHTAVCRALCAGIQPCGNLSLWLFFIICPASFIFTSCDIEDERDLCCDRIVMEYHYMRDGQDKFKDNISTLRHFLFDGHEKFLKEVPPGSDPQQQELEAMEAGNYIMVTVGNAADGTLLMPPSSGSRLQDFMLHVAGEDGRNTDPLFYGICRFGLLRESGNREQHFVTQMSNVHCRLKVTVKWQNRPPVMTQDPIYRMVLEDCARNYELDAANGYSMGEKHFPFSPHWQQEHRTDCSLDSRQLKHTFVSLRYTNRNLPVLHILCKEGEEYVEQTPPLDLKTAFSAWGYRPSTAESQNYRIVVTIYMDGHVGVKVEMDAGIADWVDGGAFG